MGLICSMLSTIRTRRRRAMRPRGIIRRERAMIYELSILLMRGIMLQRPRARILSFRI
jgi:hypothetical protein